MKTSTPGHSNARTWGPIGRPLRLAVLGPIERAQRVVGGLGDGVDLFDGQSAGLEALRPDAVDAVIAVDGDDDDLTEAVQRLRAQLVGVVRVVPEARVDVLTHHLGVVFGSGPAFEEVLRNLVSVAAQTTWALMHAAALTPKRLVAPRLKAEIAPRMTSSTRPWVPSADTLASLAVDEDDLAESKTVPAASSRPKKTSRRKRRGAAKKKAPQRVSFDDVTKTEIAAALAVLV